MANYAQAVVVPGEAPETDDEDDKDIPDGISTCFDKCSDETTVILKTLQLRELTQI
jgi:hypothetical protein